MENDRAFAELLNDCLDAIERGEASIEECLARHPQHAAQLEGLLCLGEQARSLALPAPTQAQMAAGEERLLRAVRSKAAHKQPEPESTGPLATLKRRLIEPAKARLRSWPKWSVPALAASASLVLLFACVFAVTLGTGATWWATRNREAGSERAAATPSRSPTQVPGTAVAERPGQTAETGVAETPIQTPVPTPEQDTADVVYLPVLTNPLPPDQAMLREVQGLVEFQSDGQTWAAAGPEQIVQAGQRVRTGALSNAEIVFYDGSVARLGPESELSIDHLGQDPADESRLIELTQWAGESDHDVTPAYNSRARYEVHTPSGTGKALGTSFHVRVIPGSLSHFSVDDGAVAVIHLDVTVVVVAGQLTTVPVGQPPHEPFFRVSGEGEVTQVGPTWEIGGQVFETHDQTVVVGNPQVGDWVSVDGHLLPDGTRVADQIVLLRRAPENRFMIEGEVEAQQEDTDGRVVSATIAGQEIVIGEETEVDDDIQIGDRVRVEGTIDASGTLLAETIHLIAEPGVPFRLVGVVQEISDAVWVVSGLPIAVDEATLLDDGLAVGDIVRVRGLFLEGEGGTWQARSIRHVSQGERRFEFVGLVEGIDPWVVSGIEVETRAWTEIVDPIEIGDRVVVEGRILPDGTWLADEIKRAGEDDALGFEFVGRVQSIDPWNVGGISLVVDQQTEIADPIEIGDRAKVEGRILPDGTWLADEIKLLEEPSRRGCTQVTSIVVRVSAGLLVLQDGTTIPVEDTLLIEGQVQVNSVIRIDFCIDDGEVTILRVIVLYQLEPPPIAQPTPTRPSQPSPTPPSQPPSPHGGGGSMVVNHNNVTQTFTCNGHSVTINGNNNTITLLGSCGPVTIRGNNNVVSIRSATSVTNRGNNNTIVGP